MSLPTSSAKPSQLSIRSFFSSGSSKYAPPPSQKSQPTTAPNLDHAAKPSPGTASTSATAPNGVSNDKNKSTNHQQQEQQLEQQLEQQPLPPLPSDLPREACIRPLNPQDVNPLRRINALLLPVSYPDSFYERAVDPAASGRFSRVITWAHDAASEPKVVGGVVCRLEPSPLSATSATTQSQVPQNLYLQSLCLLSPYRGMGLVSAAVDHIVATAVADPMLDVRTVTAHVWTENEEGLKWYDAHSFSREGPPLRGFYLKLRPDTALLVQRNVSASVRNSLPKSSSSSPPQAATRTSPSGTTAAVMNMPPSTASAPPKTSDAQRPRPPPRTPSSGQSFQNQRAETEWNDLPDDMAPGRLAPPAKASEPGSSASSRSSSKVRKKRDRSYPAAAFGS